MLVLTPINHVSSQFMVLGSQFIVHSYHLLFIVFSFWYLLLSSQPIVLVSRFMGSRITGSRFVVRGIWFMGSRFTGLWFSVHNFYFLLLSSNSIDCDLWVRGSWFAVRGSGFTVRGSCVHSSGSQLRGSRFALHGF